MMAKNPLKSPELYLNRELSWLEFNDRVLREGLSAHLPLLERLKFLAIVSSNLDEFFLIRVAGLMQQRSAGVRRRDPAGMTPSQQLAAISERVHRMVEEQSEGIAAALAALGEHGVFVHEPADWTEEHRRHLAARFAREIEPVLTPLAIQDLDPPPLLPSLQLHVAALVAMAPPEEPPVEGKPGGRGKKDRQPERLEKIVVVPVPSQFPRFLAMPSEKDVHLVRLEDAIAAHVAALFPGAEVLATAVCRVTRDADVELQEEEAGDLLQVVEEAVRTRRRRAAVRLGISAGADRRILDWLRGWLGLRDEEVYEVDGMLDATALWEIVRLPGLEHLKNPDWPPQTPRDLLGHDDLWEAVEDHDVMLFHPYESFEPLVRLLEAAAADPNVLAIKQTLYRTSGDSPIVRALERAAGNGKEVTALVELKARFDEARNVHWARRLEDAGCHVIYGIAGLKTHAKALLIVRRQGQRIQRYVHLATGNYNDRTAKLYSDIGLLTCDRDVAADVAAFFNLLTGYSETVGWNRLSVAPTGLKPRLLDMIDREIQASTPDRPGLIMAKTNSLQDADMIRALYRASQAGVKILLNVRGICCLRPGLKGFSETIEVRSIIDRYLEHARIFYFRNGGHEEVYLSSADWMRRNLDRRLEILFPVLDRGHRRRLIDALNTYFADNVQARRLKPDGTYEPVARKGPRLRAQEKLYQEAVAHVRAAEKAEPQFQPLQRPEE
jgi:polyphosphate kinase